MDIKIKKIIITKNPDELFITDWEGNTYKVIEDEKEEGFTVFFPKRKRIKV